VRRSVSDIVLSCDVEDIASVVPVRRLPANGDASTFWFIHRLRRQERTPRRYADTTRENFLRTMLISCFSFTEVASGGRADARTGGS